jgi:hypothetical protein
MNHKAVNCFMQHITCDLFSNSFNLCLQLLNSVWVGGAYDLWGISKGNNCKDSYPVNMAAKTTHIRSTLEIDSTGHSYQNPSCRTPMTTYAVELLVCYDALNKDWSNKTLPVDCTPHGALCRMEWCLHDFVQIFGGPELCVLLFAKPLMQKWASSLNHRQSKVAQYWCANCKKSWQISCLCCLLQQWGSVPLWFHKDTTSNPITWWCVLMFFWYHMAGDTVSQVFLDSKTTLCIHEQHCPACMLTCAFPPHLFLVTNTTN